MYVVATKAHINENYASPLSLTVGDFFVRYRKGRRDIDNDWNVVQSKLMNIRVMPQEAD